MDLLLPQPVLPAAKVVSTSGSAREEAAPSQAAM